MKLREGPIWLLCIFHFNLYLYVGGKFCRSDYLMCGCEIAHEIAHPLYTTHPPTRTHTLKVYDTLEINMFVSCKFLFFFFGRHAAWCV